VIGAILEVSALIEDAIIRYTIGNVVAKKHR
jgi:chaperonin cofactor prefoldin